MSWRQLPYFLACASGRPHGTTSLVPAMKRVVQAILIVAFILAFGLFIYFFAKLRQENLDATLPVAGRIMDLSTAPGEPGSTRGGTTPSQRSKINPEWGETFLDAIDMNLDEDEDLEQVLIVKPAATENVKISIVIADFQPATGSYFRLWKGETLATKPNAVVVQPRDLLGDGSVDLLCFGIDDSNRQTLNVFRRTASGSYSQVFSGAGLSITIDDSPEAATISVFESAPASSSPLDQKRVLYSWSPAHKAFARESEMLVPGENVEQLFINKILTGRAEDFEAYLDGLWLKEDANNPIPTYVYFDADERKISIHSKDEQQQWDWGGSNTAFAGIYASISNSAVPEMLRLLGIDLVGVDKVRIRATAQQIVKFALKEDWNGVYKRVAGQDVPTRRSGLAKAPTDGPFTVRIEGSKVKMRLRPSDFEGFYASTSGFSLDLRANNFLFARVSGSSRGYYSLFNLNDSAILDLSLVDDKSILSGRLSYIIEVRPGKGSGISTLILKHANILLDKAEQLYEPDIVLSRFDN